MKKVKQNSIAKRLLMVLITLIGLGGMTKIQAATCSLSHTKTQSTTDCSYKFYFSQFSVFSKNDPGTLTINFGDGTSKVANLTDSTFKGVFIHKYSKTGVFKAKITIATKPCNLTTTDSFSVGSCVPHYSPNIKVSTGSICGKYEITISNYKKFLVNKTDRIYCYYADGTSDSVSIFDSTFNGTFHHNYLKNGGYGIFVKVNSDSCIGSAKDSINITCFGTSKTCNAEFKSSSTACNAELSFAKYSNYATNPSGKIYIYASNGMMDSLNLQDSGFIGKYHLNFKGDGTYFIKTKIVSGTCIDTYANSVTITNCTPRTYYLSGNVFRGKSTNRGDDGYVFLYKFNPIDSTVTNLDTFHFAKTDSIQGHYYFTNLVKGHYMVIGVLDSISAYKNKYFPTYGDSAIAWYDGNLINLDSTPYYREQNIHLVEGNNTAGTGSFLGFVLQGKNKVGDPLKSVQVQLLGMDKKKAIKSVYSDANGQFDISGIPYGTYYLKAEVIGKKSTGKFVTISAQNPTIKNLLITVSNSGVVTAINTESDFNSNNSRISVYPNPVKESLNINLGNSVEGYTTIQVIDLQGRVVIKNNSNFNKSIDGLNYPLNVNSLNPGMYILSITSKNGNTNKLIPFIKQ